MKYLVTGAAGFIGYHVCLRLLEQGSEIIGFDNLNNYYDVGLKQARLQQLQARPGFRFVKADLEDAAAVSRLFQQQQFDRVIHLAAQAGVRYSVQNPSVYAQSNLVGHLNILEGCRQQAVNHLVYASSSSVYGLNTSKPFATDAVVDHPVSLYAASKKANELMAHTYSHLYGLPTTGLRFFTVYGPWGRPDMALFKFTRAMLAGEPVDVYNHGNMSRDFTYISDIVDGIVALLDKVPQPDSSWTPEQGSAASSSAPYAIFNIGSGKSVQLLDFIAEIEASLGLVATRNLLPMQPGDVPTTFADTKALREATGVQPQVDIAEGIASFVRWYKNYYSE